MFYLFFWFFYLNFNSKSKRAGNMRKIVEKRKYAKKKWNIEERRKRGVTQRKKNECGKEERIKEERALKRERERERERGEGGGGRRGRERKNGNKKLNKKLERTVSKVERRRETKKKERERNRKKRREEKRREEREREREKKKDVWERMENT